MEQLPSISRGAALEASAAGPGVPDGSVPPHPSAPGRHSCRAAPFSWAGFGASEMCMSTLHSLGRRCPVASVTIIIKCHPREVALTVGITVSLDCRPS